MNKKSLTVLIAALAMLLLPTSMRASEQLLVLTQTNGSVTKFALTDDPVITYKGNDVIVTCGENVLQTSMADITDIGFKKEETTGIEETVAASESKTTFSFGQAGFEGLQPGERVLVYSMDGKVISAIKADADGRAQVDMNDLQTGVYILRTAKKSFKIKK